MAFAIEGQSAASGDAMTVGSYVVIRTVTTAGVFQLVVSNQNLTGVERLIVRVRRKLLSGDSLEQVDEFDALAAIDANKQFEDIPRTNHHTSGLEYALKQEGGSARNIKWLITQLQ